jgi:transposase
VCEAILDVIARAPSQFGVERTRWTLATLLGQFPWLRCHTQAGLCRLLHRIGISYKRGRHHLHSPDPDYEAKLKVVCDCLRLAAQEPEKFILLFVDELSYYRQPTLSRGYAARGHEQPLAELSYRANKPGRVLGAVNALTGRVHYLAQGQITVATLVGFYKAIRRDYPQAKTIWIVLDNWPVHFHPDVLAALEPQLYAWQRHNPSNWSSQPRKTAARLNLPIQLLALPTYAPWTNPIEQLWRWLKQEVLHLHRYADNLPELKARVAACLDRFRRGSEELLRYIGLRAPHSRYWQSVTPVLNC